MEISLTELEQAINYWRTRCPSRGEERRLSTEVNTLATVYAVMIFNQAKTLSLDSLDIESRQLLEVWYQHRS